MEHNFERLKEDILPLSKSDSFHKAKNEYLFLTSTRRKRKLSPAQNSWKKKINRRIVNKIVVSKQS